jgi:hypothetical protein
VSRLGVGVLAGSAALLALACHGSRAFDPGPATPSIEYVTAQEILTPLPVRVRLPASYGAEHVIVLYRTWGSHGWSQIELARHGQTWAGEVSCREVSTVTGDTRYFFLVLDREGEIVGGSGSPDWPHIVTIVGSLEGGPRALPLGAFPLRCHDPSDCPPDFPGCPAYAFQRAACRSDRDCPGKVACAWDGYCGSPAGPVPAKLEHLPPSDGDAELSAAIAAARLRHRRTASRLR